MTTPAVQRDLLDQLTGALEVDPTLRALLDALPDTVVVFDEAGRVLFAAEGIEALSGYRPEELTGRPVELLVPPRRRAAHARTRREFEEAPTARPMAAQQDITLHHRDGGEVAVDVSLAPLEARGRRFSIAAIRPADERRVAEQAVYRALRHEQEAAAKLREAAGIKNAFIRAISHELRTPLTVVQGLAETLEARAGGFSTRQIQQLAARLARNAERLDGLLGDLLDVDRLTRGTVTAERQVVDVAALARQVVERCGTGDRPVVLEVPDHLPAEVDPAQVERILENLLHNAFKYSPAGTPVTVRATLDLEAGGLRLDVEDQGTGVPDELRESVFEPFFRVDDSSPAPGTGVGLSLVAEFARLHGGRAWIEDLDGVGCAFRVLLPPP
jgi:two-component system, LuxR family, sensor kinase FixL